MYLSMERGDELVKTIFRCIQQLFLTLYVEAASALQSVVLSLLNVEGLHKIIIIIIQYIYHALINALSAHITHINLNTIFYTYVQDSLTKTIYIRH